MHAVHFTLSACVKFMFNFPLSKQCLHRYCWHDELSYWALNAIGYTRGIQKVRSLT